MTFYETFLKILLLCRTSAMLVPSATALSEKYIIDKFML